MQFPRRHCGHARAWQVYSWPLLPVLVLMLVLVPACPCPCACNRAQLDQSTGEDI